MKGPKTLSATDTLVVLHDRETDGPSNVWPAPSGLWPSSWLYIRLLHSDKK